MNEQWKKSYNIRLNLRQKTAKSESKYTKGKDECDLRQQDSERVPPVLGREADLRGEEQGAISPLCLRGSSEV